MISAPVRKTSERMTSPAWTGAVNETDDNSFITCRISFFGIGTEDLTESGMPDPETGITAVIIRITGYGKERTVIGKLNRHPASDRAVNAGDDLFHRLRLRFDPYSYRITGD